MSKNFGCCRWVYNWALAKSIEIWKTEKRLPKKYEFNSLLPSLKKVEETAWLSEAASQSLQRELLFLDRAYKNFYKHKARFPKFKSKKSKQRYGCTASIRVLPEEGVISLPKTGKIKAALHRQFEGRIVSAVVTKTLTNKYYVAITVEDGTKEPPKNDFGESTTLGLDLGLINFITTSTGEKISNPRFTRDAQKQIKKAQRALARKKPDSKNYSKQRLVLARIHERTKNRRSDFMHKLSTRLIRENQAIAIEILNISAMKKMRSALCRSIVDTGWYEFTQQLEYKAKRYGKTILKIGMFEPSSRLCSCGTINKQLTMKQRTWTCKSCGAVWDRDTLAANNIKQMALSQIGQEVPEFTPVER